MRRLTLFAAMLLLSGCGLHPLYGTHDASDVSPGGSKDAMVGQELAAIRVDTIADRQGQELRNVLIDRFQSDGVPPEPRYELSIIYTETQQDLGVNNNATSTRGQLSINASFSLKDLATGSGELAGNLQEITGYNIQYSEFSTIVSRDDAELRALREAADNIAYRISLYFENKLYHPERLRKPAAPVQPATPPQAPAVPPSPGLFPSQPFSNQTPITQGP